MRPPRVCQAPRDAPSLPGRSRLLPMQWRVRARGLVGLLFALGFLLDLARLLLHFALQLVDLAAPLRRAVARDLAELLLHLALGLLHLALDPIFHVAPPLAR